MRLSVEIAVKNRIIDHGRGWCFTPMHFSDLGSDPSNGAQAMNEIHLLSQSLTEE